MFIVTNAFAVLFEVGLLTPTGNSGEFTVNKTRIYELVLLGLFALVVWFGKRSISKFDKSVDKFGSTLESIIERVGKVEGDIQVIKKEQEMHSKQDEERHDHITGWNNGITKRIEGLENRRGGNGAV